MEDVDDLNTRQFQQKVEKVDNECNIVKHSDAMEDLDEQDTAYKER